MLDLEERIEQLEQGLASLREWVTTELQQYREDAERRHQELVVVMKDMMNRMEASMASCHDSWTHWEQLAIRLRVPLSKNEDLNNWIRESRKLDQQPLQRLEVRLDPDDCTPALKEVADKLGIPAKESD